MVKQVEDKRTMELIDPPKRGRGRPSGDKPALTAAQRQARRRALLAENGWVRISIDLPADLVRKIDKIAAFLGDTRDEMLRDEITRAVDAIGGRW